MHRDSEPWLDRLQPPIGYGAGSYALGDARDLGAPDVALPALRDGGIPPSSRLRSLGLQAIMDPVAQAGGGWIEVQPDPYA